MKTRRHKKPHKPDIPAIDAALALVRTELIRATSKHGPFNSSHEGYGVIAEEFDELLDEIRANKRRRQIKEAIQVAAMATRFIVDI